jgi:hypothetical protein
MDGILFDEIAQSARESRRALLAAVLAATIGQRFAFTSDARKKGKRKKKEKKVKPNEFGCLEIGDPCQNAGQCCSGVCDGKKGKRNCRAHGTGTCEQGAPGFCEAGVSGICDNATNCFCSRTTAGSNFCGDILFASGTNCADCKKDADCEAQGFPPGSACVPFATGFCAGNCEGGMVCMARCGTTIPEPED